MKTFRLGQRVTVSAVGQYEEITIDPPMAGRIVRLRRGDNAAWIALDTRSDAAGAHPFPADDEHGRGIHVLAYPDDCEPA